jgi:hypothetical protein
MILIAALFVVIPLILLVLTLDDLTVAFKDYVEMVREDYDASDD